MRKYTSAIIILFFSVLPLCGQASDRNGYLEYLPFEVIENLILDLNPAEASLLDSSGRLTNFTKGASTHYAPSPDTAREVRNHIEDMDPNISVEAVFILPLPPALQEQDDLPLLIYNILRSVSTMTGIEYYSASRERMRIFYHEAFAVTEKSEKARIPDPLVGEIPGKEKILVFQHDSSFGKNYVTLEYLKLKNGFHINMMNLTTMWYGILPIVRPGNLKVTMSVILGEESIVFYGNSNVRVIGLFGMENRVKDSFSNRLIALYDWFKDRLHSYR
jgi:hypothetical protein